MKNQQFELDILLERVNEICKRADKTNKQNIQKESAEASTEWYSLISDLESRRDALSKLAQVWETFEGRYQHFESLLTGLEEKSKHVDLIVRNRQHVINTKQNIEILQSEADSLKQYQEEVLHLSNSVLLFLRECSATSADALSEKLRQLSENYERLIDNLKQQSQKTDSNLHELDYNLIRISRSKDELRTTQARILDFYVFDQNFLQTEIDLRNLQSEVDSDIKQVRDLISSIKNKYIQLQQLVPSDIAQELNALELFAEEVLNNMEEKTKEFKKARTVRSDYITEVKDVQNWIKDAELKIQDRSIEPHLLSEHLQKIQSEILNTADQVEKLTKNGRIIMDKTRDDEEKKLVQSSIDNLTDQLHKIRSLLDEKKQQVTGAQDAWKRFLNLYEAVMTWVKEKEQFLKEPVVVSSLSETKQKLHDYGNAVKSCKTASKNLSDMAKELDHIASVTSVGDLPQKMEEAEEAKVEVESKILARNSLLQETSEEWEQCEKKIKDVRSWMDKTKSALESPQNKKKPLRDQHALREKLVNDCQIQKTKIGLSVDKLQLHFRSGIGGDSKVAESADELCSELDELNVAIKEQSRGIRRRALFRIGRTQCRDQGAKSAAGNGDRPSRPIPAGGAAAETADPPGRTAVEGCAESDAITAGFRANVTRATGNYHFALLPRWQALLAQKDLLKSKINSHLAEVRDIDPYNDAKGLTYAEIVAGQLLQQQQQQQQQQSREMKLEKPTILTLSEPVDVPPQIVEKLKPDLPQQTCGVEVIEAPTILRQNDVQSPPPTIVAPSADIIDDFVKKESKPKPNRARGRSPNKRDDKPKSKIPKKFVDPALKSEPQINLKTPEDSPVERKRAKSPIWIPGSTTYAEILMGSTQPAPLTQKKDSKKEEEADILPLRKIETSQQTDAVENVEFMTPTSPIQTSEEVQEQYSTNYVEDVPREIPEVSSEKSENNVYVSIESQSWVEPQIEYQHPQTTYELPVTLPQIPTSTYYQTIPQQNLPPGMYGCIQPVPDLVGFIASGQQLMSSGLGTYHSSSQYPNIPVYPNQSYQQYYDVQETQEQPSYSYTSPSYVGEDIDQSPQQPHHEKKHKTKEVKHAKDAQPKLAQSNDEIKHPTKEIKPLTKEVKDIASIDAKPCSQFSYAQILSQGLSTEQLQPSSIPIRRSQSPSNLSPRHSDQLMPTDDRMEVKRDVTEPLSTVKVDKRLTTKTKKRYAYIELEEPTQSDQTVYRGELDVKSSGTTEVTELVPDENKPPTFSDTDKTDKQKKRKKTKPRKSSKDEIDKALKEIQEITEIKRKGHRKDSQSSQQDLTSDSAKPELEQLGQQKKKTKKKSDKIETKENIEIIDKTSTADDATKINEDSTQKKKKHKKKKPKSKPDTAEKEADDSKLYISESSTQKASSEETLNTENTADIQKKSKAKKKPKPQPTQQITQPVPQEDVMEITTQKESSEETLSPTEVIPAEEHKKSKNKKKSKKSKKTKIESEIPQETPPQKTSSEETLSPSDAAVEVQKISNKNKKKKKPAVTTDSKSEEAKDEAILHLQKDSSEEAIGVQNKTQDSKKKSKKKKKSKLPVVTTEDVEDNATAEESKPSVEVTETVTSEKTTSLIPIPKARKNKKKNKAKSTQEISSPELAEPDAAKEILAGETPATQEASKDIIQEQEITETIVQVQETKEDADEPHPEAAQDISIKVEIDLDVEIKKLEKTEDTITPETVVQTQPSREVNEEKTELIHEAEKPKKKHKKAKAKKGSNIVTTGEEEPKHEAVVDEIIKEELKTEEVPLIEDLLIQKITEDLNVTENPTEVDATLEFIQAEIGVEPVSEEIQIETIPIEEEVTSAQEVIEVKSEEPQETEKSKKKHKKPKAKKETKDNMQAPISQEEPIEQQPQKIEETNLKTLMPHLNLLEQKLVFKPKDTDATLEFIRAEIGVEPLPEIPLETKFTEQEVESAQEVTELRSETPQESEKPKKKQKKPKGKKDVTKHYTEVLISQEEPIEQQPEEEEEEPIEQQPEEEEVRPIEDQAIQDTTIDIILTDKPTDVDATLEFIRAEISVEPLPEIPLETTATEQEVESAQEVIDLRSETPQEPEKSKKKHKKPKGKKDVTKDITEVLIKKKHKKPKGKKDVTKDITEVLITQEEAIEQLPEEEIKETPQKIEEVPPIEDQAIQETATDIILTDKPRDIDATLEFIGAEISVEPLPEIPLETKSTEQEQEVESAQEVIELRSETPQGPEKSKKKHKKPKGKKDVIKDNTEVLIPQEEPIEQQPEEEIKETPQKIEEVPSIEDQAIQETTIDIILTDKPRDIDATLEFIRAEISVEPLPEMPLETTATEQEVESAQEVIDLRSETPQEPEKSKKKHKKPKGKKDVTKDITEVLIQQEEPIAQQPEEEIKETPQKIEEVPPIEGQAIQDTTKDIILTDKPKDTDATLEFIRAEISVEPLPEIPLETKATEQENRKNLKRNTKSRETPQESEKSKKKHKKPKGKKEIKDNTDVLIPQEERNQLNNNLKKKLKKHLSKLKRAEISVEPLPEIPLETKTTEQEVESAQEVIELKSETPQESEKSKKKHKKPKESEKSKKKHKKPKGKKEVTKDNIEVLKTQEEPIEQQPEEEIKETPQKIKEVPPIEDQAIQETTKDIILTDKPKDIDATLEFIRAEISVEPLPEIPLETKATEQEVECAQEVIELRSETPQEPEKSKKKHKKPKGKKEIKDNTEKEIKDNTEVLIPQEEPIEQQLEEEIKETPQQIEEVPPVEDQAIQETTKDIILTDKPKDIDATLEFIRAEISVEPLPEIPLETKATEHEVESAQHLNLLEQKLVARGGIAEISVEPLPEIPLETKATEQEVESAQEVIELRSETPQEPEKFKKKHKKPKGKKEIKDNTEKEIKDNTEVLIPQEEPIEQQLEEEIKETPQQIEEAPPIEDQAIQETTKDIILTDKPEDIDATLEFIRAEISVEPLPEIPLETKSTEQEKKQKKPKGKKDVTKDNTEVLISQEEPIEQQPEKEIKEISQKIEEVPPIEDQAIQETTTDIILTDKPRDVDATLEFIGAEIGVEPLPEIPLETKYTEQEVESAQEVIELKSDTSPESEKSKKKHRKPKGKKEVTKDNTEVLIPHEEPIEQQPAKEINGTPQKLEEVPPIEDQAIQDTTKDIILTDKPKDSDATLEFIRAEIGVEPLPEIPLEFIRAEIGVEPLPEIPLETKSTEQEVESAQEVIELRSETLPEKAQKRKKGKSKDKGKKIVFQTVADPVSFQTPAQETEIMKIERIADIPEDKLKIDAEIASSIIDVNGHDKQEEPIKAKKESKKKKKDKKGATAEKPKEVIQDDVEVSEPIQEFAGNIAATITQTLTTTQVEELSTTLSNEEPNVEVKLSPTVEERDEICSKGYNEVVPAKLDNIEDASIAVGVEEEKVGDNTKTNKFILITHEEVKMQPVVSLKMEIATSPEREIKDLAKEEDNVAKSEQREEVQQFTQEEIEIEQANLAKEEDNVAKSEQREEVQQFTQEEIEIEQAIFGSVKDRSRGKHTREISNEFISLEAATRIDQTDVEDVDMPLSKSDSFDNVTEETSAHLTRLESIVDVEIKDISEVMDVLAKKKISRKTKEPQVTSPAPATSSSAGNNAKGDSSKNKKKNKRSKRKKQNKTKQEEIAPITINVTEESTPILDKPEQPKEVPLSHFKPQETLSPIHALTKPEQPKEVPLSHFKPQETLSPIHALTDDEISGEELVCHENENEDSKRDDTAVKLEQDLKLKEQVTLLASAVKLEQDLKLKEQVTLLASTEKLEEIKQIEDQEEEKEVQQIEPTPIEASIEENPAEIIETPQEDVALTEATDNIENLCGLASDAPKYDIMKIVESETQWIISQNEEEIAPKDTIPDKEDVSLKIQLESADKSEIFLEGLGSEIPKYDLPKMFEYEAAWYALNHQPQEITQEEEEDTKPIEIEKQPQLQKEPKAQEVPPKYDLPKMFEYEAAWYALNHQPQEITQEEEEDTKPIEIEKQPQLQKEPKAQEVPTTQEVQPVESPERKLLGMVDDAPKYDVKEIAKSETDYFIIKEIEQAKQEETPIVKDEEPQPEEAPIIDDQNLERIMAIISEGKQSIDEIVSEFVESTQTKAMEEDTVPPVLVQQPKRHLEPLKKIEKPTDIILAPQPQYKVDSPSTPKHFMYDVLQFNIAHNRNMTQMLEDEIADFAKQTKSDDKIVDETETKQALELKPEETVQSTDLGSIPPQEEELQQRRNRSEHRSWINSTSRRRTSTKY
ncbi:hypothetical protein QE152_g25509 [Popillia japonica]|uniref:Muscle-specific protein 300 n=1 Tax=Popillia japonica TaxID=7064 RepID=A0AAW1K0T4_POPJA